MPLTASQTLAVETRGRPLLVSAAAGSGKTRVLVERLLRQVDEGADIDEFLVITYTRAAAAELRSRILVALNERLAADPANRRLRRQTELCCRAGIGTIDSVCGRILRENVHLSALPPDFRVMEQERSESMKRSVLDRLLDGIYETLDARPGLRALVDSEGAGEDDARLSELVLKLYDSLQSHPDPAAWAEHCRAAMRADAGGDAGATVWGRYLLSLTASRASYWARRLEETLSVLRGEGHEGLFAAYGESFAESAAGLRALARACSASWDGAAALLPVPFPKLRPFRGEDERKESATAVRRACQDACKRMAEDLSAPSAQLLEELEGTRPAMEALLELTLELDRAYAAEKRRQGLVDFSDQEHMVLRLLEDESSGVRAELAGRWREVMVDEYQDVNECQERLFAALSGGGRRLFLVGDVKQSIYRFRLADPGIFLRKYRVFSPVVPGETGAGGGVVCLRENFRSSQGVIDAVNAVFENLLSEELGELDYDEGARLVHGRAEDAAPGRALLSILALPDGGDGEARPDATALEAAMVASQIRALVEGGTRIPDGEGTRPVGYGDIAILLRSSRVPGGVFRAALEREGVPCVSQQGGGFFRSLEVTVLLSLLAVVDNPRQDIPLIAVLRSPLYGFTADELAAVRACDRAADFYTALRAAAAGGQEKCVRFLAELEEARALTPDLGVEGLRGHLCAKGELFALLSALPDGQARRENLQVLLDYARQFEQSGYRGLFRFVAWMKRLAERGEEPRTGEVSRGDAVRILSIHRSKGLEYPVVFLCNTGRRFNLSDTRGSVLVHPDLGLGAKVTDTARGVEYPSLSWRAVAARLRRESLSEELRVLYVAMTRARERLYVSCAWPDPAGRLQKLAEGLVSPVPPPLLETDASCADWLARCALLRPDALELRVVQPGEGADADAVPAAPPREAPELHLREKLSWRYPWAGCENLPSKLTASGLKAGELDDPDAGGPLPPPRPARRPELGGAERPLTGGEKGTAVHLALQFLDLRRAGSEAELRAELERLRREGRLTERQAAAVRPEWLADFFRSDVGRRILGARRVLREQRFTLLLRAEELYDVPAGDEILLQGVVDCCIEEEGGLAVIDYKTDYVTPETLAAKADGYAAQVRAYAEAMERILRQPVREGVLYFLRLGRSVRVPLDAAGPRKNACI